MFVKRLTIASEFCVRYVQNYAVWMSSCLFVYTVLLAVLHLLGFYNSAIQLACSVLMSCYTHFLLRRYFPFMSYLSRFSFIPTSYLFPLPVLISSLCIQYAHSVRVYI